MAYRLAWSSRVRNATALPVSCRGSSMFLNLCCHAGCVVPVALCRESDVRSGSCPLHPDERTWPNTSVTSEKCRWKTHAPQQTPSPTDHLMNMREQFCGSSIGPGNAEAAMNFTALRPWASAPLRYAAADREKLGWTWSCTIQGSQLRRLPASALDPYIRAAADRS